ncbi:two-component sensor histidine kinase [Kribbella pittospori]|uniref:Two-component sensor histidine kinase n=1 Tax=Kribbella pittospori TaxID=722689 RepID=A0A4R0K872_9ACTN|nr:histidine kinase [Kribbella pittospori]TCC55124.1 two-component sensor histidine kinase [Kribbella pittospori]
MNASSSTSRRLLAGGLGAFAVAEVVAGVAIAVAIGLSWSEAVDAFVVTNGLMGLTFGLCGAVIAWHRPSNPIGWLFIADGIGHATTAFGGPLAVALPDDSAIQRVTVTVALAAWPWSIGLFLPLALLLFPTGHLLSPRWRWAAIGIIVTAPLFVLEMVGSGDTLSPGVSTGYLTIPSYDALGPLWTATELRNLVAILLAIVCLFVRYRRADEMGRRQLLWLLLASVIALLFVTPWSFVAGTPIFVLLTIPLIPISVAVAIVRYQLLDIRLVVSRALTWALLSLVAIGAYSALAALLGTLISSHVGRSAAITVLLALILAPILPRLQRLVDRALYGDRRDPARVASRVGEQLSVGLPGVVAAIRSALRFPYVGLIVDNTTVATDGIPPQTVVPLELEYGGRVVATLEVGLRSGESTVSSTDRDVLALVAVPLAAAVHATRLSTELQSSREKLVSAREEERRRIRRDLHDGLGPTLTGVAFTADAAANLVSADPVKAADLLATLRADTRTAIADVRRLVDNLRPPALDELGLVGALRQRADQLSFRADGAFVHVEVSADGLPALPAALEVAAYRIATEALNNVVKHSHATSAVLALRCGPDLEVEVTDNGPPNGAWRPGVGLQAMHDRATELGGHVAAGPTPTGGKVQAHFPLTPT